MSSRGVWCALRESFSYTPCVSSLSDPLRTAATHTITPTPMRTYLTWEVQSIFVFLRAHACVIQQTHHRVEPTDLLCRTPCILSHSSSCDTYHPNRVAHQPLCVHFACVPCVLLSSLSGLLRHKDSAYIRALGFLYLRCVVDSKLLWGWFEPFLNDTQTFVPGAQDRTPKTIGAFIRELLEKNDYYGMKLKRIPVPIQRDYQLKFLAADARAKRGIKNEPYRSLIHKGMKLQAEYLEDSKFYDAIVDRIEEGEGGRFVVTYVQYGNQEEVEIGSLKLPTEILDGPLPSASSTAANARNTDRAPMPNEVKNVLEGERKRSQQQQHTHKRAHTHSNGKACELDCVRC